MYVGVIGLGKLGLATAAWLASRGHVVIGYDKNPRIRHELAQRKCPYPEPGLEALLGSHYYNDNNDKTLTVVNSIDKLTAHAAIRVFMIIVPTPSTLAEPAFDNSYVESVLDELSEAISSQWAAGRGQQDFVINVVSTVMPGSHEGFIRRVERRLGKQGDVWHYVYNPEFIALGSILKDLSKPSFVLVGIDPDADDCGTAGTLLDDLYTNAAGNTQDLQFMSWLEAELCKLCCNVAVTFKMTAANVIGHVCRQYAADSKKVLATIGSDRRIGSYYLKPSLLGFGGPCFPRDVRAIESILPKYGQYTLPQHAVNSVLRKKLYDRIRAIAAGNSDKTVAFLGVAYKPGTPVYEESQVVELMKNLNHEYAIQWWDPFVEALPELGRPKAANVFEAVKDADVVVIGTDDPYWAQIPRDAVKALVAPHAVIFHCWADA